MSLGNPPHGDPVEGRGHRIKELLEGKTEGMPSPEMVSTKLQKVAELARKTPEGASLISGGARTNRVARP
jgi:hypothetical protein